MAVRIFHPGVKLPIRVKARLTQFIPELFDRERKPLRDLSIIFCTDDQLLSLNREFLGHEDYTDILTFDLSVPPRQGMTGELYISVERVRENAAKFKESFDNELYRVIFHGMLHLCGYKDKTRKEKLLIRHKENEYVEMFFGR